VRTVLIERITFSFLDCFEGSDRFPDRLWYTDVRSESVLADPHAFDGRCRFCARLGLNDVGVFEGPFAGASGKRDPAALGAFLDVFRTARNLDLYTRPGRTVLVDGDLGRRLVTRVAALIAGRRFVVLAVLVSFRISDRPAPSAIALFGSGIDFTNGRCLFGWGRAPPRLSGRR